MEKVLPSKWSQETSRSCDPNIQLKVIKHDEEGHFIFLKGKIQQGNVSILNNYAPHAKASTFKKVTVLKLKTHIEPH